MLSAVWDDRGRPLPARRLIKSRPIIFFFFVVVSEFFCQSSGRKSFRLPQVLIKILPPELNTFLTFRCTVITGPPTHSLGGEQTSKGRSCLLSTSSDVDVCNAAGGRAGRPAVGYVGGRAADTARRASTVTSL